MGTLTTWRKAYGALKDRTEVGLAHVNSDYKDLDVAIVKATNHVESPPKERHLKKILVATSVIRPRADVAYLMHALGRRLSKTHNWTVAVKTLIVIHRALREGDPTFREELLNFQRRSRILQVSNFQDNSSPIAWDCSAWVRTYGLFLEERLECFGILKFDIEAERFPRPARGKDKPYSTTRDLDNGELLESLPALQQLMCRLIGCRPERAASRNYVIQYALALVLKESFKLYCAINDGIINLVDKFFEMSRHEAVKALEMYKRAGQQAACLSEFYEICKGLELARNFQFPVLREPPQSFILTMEEYIKEAPKTVPVRVALLNPERLMLTYKGEEDATTPAEETLEEPKQAPQPPSDEVAVSTCETLVTQPPLPLLDTDDLLGLNVSHETLHEASAIEESNGLALAIVPPGKTQAHDFDPTGWELSLVTTPSTDLSSALDRQSAGGLDSLTLNSLYEEGALRASRQPLFESPAPNPFEVADPFAASNNVPRFPTVHQMANITPPQDNPFGPFQPVYLQTQPQNNLFGETGFEAFPNASGAHTHGTDPLQSNGLI